jgi:predicted TIM-barrel fold metal-dependent hydrolase
MNRRLFLQGMLGGAIAAAAPQEGIIDSHVHFYDPTRSQGVPWPAPNETLLYRPALPDPWAKMVRPLGVSGAIVVEASAWLEDNQWVLDLAKDNPVIVGFVGHLDPGKPEFRDNLTRFRRNELFRGIRIGEKPLHDALEDPAAMADLHRLADADLALDVLGNGPLLPDVAKLSDRIPNLRIVVDHLPFDSPPGALQELRGRKHVFAKVSGVVRNVNGRVPDNADFYRKQLDELWSVFGESRVIYGSNWPVCELVAPYAVVLKVVRGYFEAKGSEAATKYFRTNAAIAYKWVARS